MQAAVDLPVAAASCSPSTAIRAARWVSVSKTVGMGWCQDSAWDKGICLGREGRNTCVRVANVYQDALRTRNDLSRGAGALM